MGILPSLTNCVSVMAAVRAQGAEERLLAGPPPLLRGGAADGRGRQDLLQGAEVRQVKTPVGKLHDSTTRLISKLWFGTFFLVRTEWLECHGDSDFLAKLHCVREACQV